MSLISSLDKAQQLLTLYGMTTYLSLGNIGLLLNILFFFQRTHRYSPCSLYLTASTFCRFLTMNISLIPIFFAVNHSDLRNTSSIFCKLQYYTRHLPNQMMRSFIVLACIDRYASCNTKPTIRWFSQYAIAIKIIPCVVILWTLVTLFIPILQSIENGKCGMYNTTYAFTYAIYNLLTSALFPPLLMIIFSSLVIFNLKQIRSRIRPTGEIVNSTMLVRKRDRDLIRMLLVEVIIYLITTTPYTVVLLYSFITRTIIKGIEEQKIESFLSFLAQSFLLHLNNALPFWIFIITIQSFRLELKKLMKTILRKLIDRFIQADEQYGSTSIFVY